MGRNCGDGPDGGCGRYKCALGMVVPSCIIESIQHDRVRGALYVHGIAPPTEGEKSARAETGEPPDRWVDEN